MLGDVEWERDPPAIDWDRALASLGGHPLQSCLWGEARREVDGIAQSRWLARREGKPVWMIRVEDRKIPGGKIAWAPRGPTGRSPELSLSLPPGFDARLKAEGYSLLVCDPWVEVEKNSSVEGPNARSSNPQTVWTDISLGKDVVFRNFHKHVRNGIRRAAKEGVTVVTTRDSGRIGEFVNLCRGISNRRGFKLRVTIPLIASLLRNTSNKDVEAALFVSLKDNKFGAGLFILRAGRNIHLIAAATDRDLRKERVGEACQWGVIEWAVEHGCTRYDLEGIDPAGHPSGYAFKMRFGGREVTLPGKQYYPLDLYGRTLAWLDTKRN